MLSHLKINSNSFEVAISNRALRNLLACGIDGRDWRGFPRRGQWKRPNAASATMPAMIMLPSRIVNLYVWFSRASARSALVTSSCIMKSRADSVCVSACGRGRLCPLAP
jgi:hypothetical protein